MTDITISIDTLPTLPDQTCWSMPRCERGSMYCLSDNRSTLQERIEKAYENGIYDVQQCCQRNMKWIIIATICIGLISGILVIILNNKDTVYPCLSYSSDTLASSVSIECLQYAWTQSCGTRAPYTFSPTYVGWWNQSPEGSMMVSCNGLKKGSNCGVGSYSNMVTYMQYCNINFNQ
jgi:hypothetical protein